MEKYSIGLDFGTLEARGMLVNQNGRIVKEASYPYPHGVISGELPDGTKISGDLTLQDPRDYIKALHKIFSYLFDNDPGAAERVIGIGIDFTQCTMMPIDKDGTPLCLLDTFKCNPYAYAKLWKHHGAGKQSERMTEIAGELGEEFLGWYGGTIYAESMFPKILETYEKCPEVYHAAGGFTELADWMTFYLTGSKKRSESIAGCAALWNPQNGYPSGGYLEACSPGFGNVIKEKMDAELVKVGETAGYLKKNICEKYGFKEKIPVAAGIGDCQAGFIGVGLCEENILLSVSGTSSCDMLVDHRGIKIPGMYGVSCGSILPDYFGYEAGQATMGDLYDWFLKNCVTESYFKEADNRKISIFDYFNILVQDYHPDQTGLLVLDWWNGNRSVLLDTDLSGMILGMDMHTRCEDIYYALSEALAFGKRRIIEQFEAYDISIKKLYMTGGAANKNPFLMQLFADTTGLEVVIPNTENGSCRGSALYGMISARYYNSFQQTVKKMQPGISKIYVPNREYENIIDARYDMYCEMYQYFGRENKIMHVLKERKRGWQR